MAGDWSTSRKSLNRASTAAQQNSYLSITIFNISVTSILNDYSITLFLYGTYTLCLYYWSSLVYSFVLLHLLHRYTLTLFHSHTLTLLHSYIFTLLLSTLKQIVTIISALVGAEAQ